MIAPLPATTPRRSSLAAPWRRRREPSPPKTSPTGGFTLVEVLLALAVGLVVGSAIVQALLAATALSQRHARQLRQQEFALRARRLLESDLRRAEGVASGGDQAGCNLGGRTPVLQLSLGTGRPPITYSRGAAPSPIWGGEVLMRCGPAFALDGAQNLGATWQNRVVLDELQAQTALVAWMQRVRDFTP